MTNRPLESWERDFFERFGANTIWTVPSRENVETILNIHSFIHQQLTLARADERRRVVQEVLELIEVNDPSSNRNTSPAYWGNMLRVDITNLTQQ